VLGFEPTKDGARSAAIGPGGLATLCFHDAGTYAFVAVQNGVEQRGSIEVGGDR
jgi:hypothetical protein